MAPTPPKHIFSTFFLVLLNISVMVSLRNLPLIAEFGYGMVFFFVVTALLFFLPSSLISAELATGWSTSSGGIYTWVKEAFGKRWGFLAIWLQWTHNFTWYSTILTFIATTCAYTFNRHLATSKGFIHAVVLTLFWGMTFFNYFGIKTSGLISSIGVFAGTIIPGFFIIALACIWLLSGHPVQIPFTPSLLLPNLVRFDNLVFLAGLFLSFAGMEVTATYAKETKDPQRSYPRAIFLSVVIVLLLVVPGSLAIAVVIPPHEINLAAGLIETLRLYLTSYGLDALLPPLAILLVFGAVAEINSWLIGPIKALHTTSMHGHLPPLFSYLNKHGMPTYLLLLQAIIVTTCSFIILWTPDISAAYWVLTATASQIYLLMYVIMFSAAIRLRYSHPEIRRPYRVPGGNVGMWIAGSCGIVASLFAFTVAFIPPVRFGTGNVLLYEGFLIAILVVIIGIPFIISSFRNLNEDRSE
ncbi:MAG: amino acid permease [Simkaniaceae bacterium]|nr:amino acid permease [Simkaniaceae bacterium]